MLQTYRAATRNSDTPATINAAPADHGRRNETGRDASPITTRVDHGEDAHRHAEALAFDHIDGEYALHQLGPEGVPDARACTPRRSQSSSITMIGGLIGPLVRSEPR